MEQTDQTYLETIEQSAEQILAPVLVEFVEWILRSAGRHGIRRIYFLARDGYPMYRAAEILSAGMSPRIECRYLRCSRYSLRVPSFCLLGRAAVDQICLGGIDVTLRKVLKRGGLTEQEAEETARAMGREEELDRILSYRQVRSLRGMLARSELFWEYVSLHAKKAYDGTVGYLRSQGLFEDMDYAVADSGWTGSIQRTLSMLVSSAGYQGQITGYYFGLWHIPADAEKGEYHAYYFGPLGKIRRKASFSNSLFECICQRARRDDHRISAYSGRICARGRTGKDREPGSAGTDPPSGHPKSGTGGPEEARETGASAGSPGEQGKAGRGQGKEGKTDKGAEEDMEKSSGSSWAALTERGQRHSGE